MPVESIHLTVAPADALRDLPEIMGSSPLASQLPEQPTCYDDFDGTESPLSPPSSFRSASSKLSELSEPGSPQTAPSRLRSSTSSQRSAPSSAATLAPKLHPSTYAASPALSDMRGPTPIGLRGCPKRHRKTIQIKRQEQQTRLESLNSRHTKLQEAVRLAATEVRVARQTLYAVLKTARQGNLEAFSPAP